MAKTTLTVRQIKDLGLWDKVCEYKDWNPWILNEGRISEDELVEFDSEFKKEVVITNSKRLEELKDSYYKGDIDHIDLIKMIIELESRLEY